MSGSGTHLGALVFCKNPIFTSWQTKRVMNSCFGEGYRSWLYITVTDPSFSRNRSRSMLTGFPASSLVLTTSSNVHRRRSSVYAPESDITIERVPATFFFRIYYFYTGFQGQFIYIHSFNKGSCYLRRLLNGRHLPVHGKRINSSQNSILNRKEFINGQQRSVFKPYGKGYH